MTEIADSIITIAAVITAFGVILGVPISIVKTIGKHKEKDRQQQERNISQDKDIARLKEENTLLVFGLSACLDGLQQLGANHSVPIAKDKLDKYINQMAHK